MNTTAIYYQKRERTDDDSEVIFLPFELPSGDLRAYAHILSRTFDLVDPEFMTGGSSSINNETLKDRWYCVESIIFNLLRAELSTIQYGPTAAGIPLNKESSLFKNNSLGYSYRAFKDSFEALRAAGWLEVTRKGVVRGDRRYQTTARLGETVVAVIPTEVIERELSDIDVPEIQSWFYEESIVIKKYVKIPGKKKPLKIVMKPSEYDPTWLPVIAKDLKNLDKINYSNSRFNYSIKANSDEVLGLKIEQKTKKTKGRDFVENLSPILRNYLNQIGHRIAKLEKKYVPDETRTTITRLLILRLQKVASYFTLDSPRSNQEPSSSIISSTNPLVVAPKIAIYRDPGNVNIEMPLATTAFSFKRSYSKTIYLGGRFYAPVSNFTQIYRKRILIDGRETVEPDFSALHPNLLYALRGLVPEGPIYSDEFPKWLFKSIMFPLLFTETRSGLDWKVINSARKRITELKADGQLTSNYSIADRQILKALRQIQDRHAPISDDFCSGKATYLQNVDAKIAERVMLKFADLSLPCICIHDSFITFNSEEERLKKVMEESYKEELSAILGKRWDHSPLIR
ncbi:hypothetical protein ES702_05219 [subsurface metagenome]